MHAFDCGTVPERGNQDAVPNPLGHGCLRRKRYGHSWPEHTLSISDGQAAPMPPPIEAPDAAAGMPEGDSLGGRKEAIIREVGLESMMQATSLARTVRASKDTASLSGKDEYKAGD